MPRNLIYCSPKDTVFAQNMPESIYKSDTKWGLEEDIKYYGMLKKNGSMNEESNVVTSYFDGIDVQVDTCLECGFQRRFFNQFREMSISVHTEFIECSVVYNDASPVSPFNYKTITLKLPKDKSSTIEMLKYLVISKIKGNKTGGIYKYMNDYELVLLKNNFVNNNRNKKKKHNLYGSEGFDGLGIILDNYNDAVSSVVKHVSNKCAVMLVPVSTLNSSSTTNKSTRREREGEYLKYIHFQVSVKKPQLLSICVLRVQNGVFTDAQFKLQLHKSGVGLYGGLKNPSSVSMVTYYNGKEKSEKKGFFYFGENIKNNANNTIVTYLRKSVTAAPRGEEEEEEEDFKFNSDANLNNSNNSNDALNGMMSALRLMMSGKGIDDQMAIIQSNLDELKSRKSKHWAKSVGDEVLNDKFGDVDDNECKLFKKANTMLLEALENKQRKDSEKLGLILKAIDLLWKNDNFSSNSDKNNVYSVKFEDLGDSLAQMESMQYLSGNDLMFEMKCFCKNQKPKLSDVTLFAFFIL